ncbi:MAG: YesL family protein [Lachnospiraceae bacterium]
MNRIFDLDNGFFRFMGKVFDMILLDLLTLVMCLPIVTIGPSLTAMYYVAMKTVRDEEGYVFQSFFRSFKQNFKQGFLIELAAVVAGGLLYIDLMVTYRWMATDSSILIKLLFYALIGFALLYAVTLVFVFPVLAKFDNSTKKTMITAMMMAVKHLPNAIFMVIVIIATAVLIYIYPYGIIFGIGLAAYINSYMLRKVFDNYIRVDSEGRVISAGTEETESNDMEKAEPIDEEAGEPAEDHNRETDDPKDVTAD